MISAKRIRIEKDHQVSTDYVGEKMDLINSLDNDSLAQIFMLLPISERITMDQVCSKWKEAYRLAWHDIKKYKCTNAIVRSYEKCILTQSYVEKVLFNCGIYLKELILSRICNSSIMPVIAEYCKNLTTLEFKIVAFGNDNTHRFVEAFTQLDQLKVLKIHISGYSFQFHMLNSLPKDINEIHLFFRPYGLTEPVDMDPTQWFVLLPSNRDKPVTSSLFSLKKFTNLRSLTIHYCTITEIIQEISKKTTLVYLDLQNCKTRNKIFTFNQLSNLEHLNIEGVSFMDSQSQNIPNLLSGIFNKCKKLKHLDAPHFYVDLAEIEIENWVNLENLVYLNIRWKASDAIINNIIKYCNNLEFINTGTLNSESVIKLTELENLDYLEFGYRNYINKEVMVAILNNCKKIKHLIIHGFSTVEASILDNLSKLQYIESLNLALSSKLGDSAIIAIAKNCKLLKCLNINNCRSITSIGYTALTSLKNLKDLNVGTSYVVDDNFIVKLRGIKIFNCFKCNRLSHAGVIQFIKNNPDLEFLDISRTNVTIDTIIAAEEAVKNRTNDTLLAIKTGVLDLEKACVKSQWLIYC